MRKKGLEVWGNYVHEDFLKIQLTLDNLNPLYLSICLSFFVTSVQIQCSSLHINITNS